MLSKFSENPWFTVTVFQNWKERYLIRPDKKCQIDFLEYKNQSKGKGEILCEELQSVVRVVRNWWDKQKDLSNTGWATHLEFYIKHISLKASGYKPVFILICLRSGFQGRSLPWTLDYRVRTPPSCLTSTRPQSSCCSLHTGCFVMICSELVKRCTSKWKRCKIYSREKCTYNGLLWGH